MRGPERQKGKIMFKKLIARVLEVKTDTELNALCADIDRAYQSGKITAQDNELLYRLINKYITKELY